MEKFSHIGMSLNYEVSNEGRIKNFEGTLLTPRFDKKAVVIKCHVLAQNCIRASRDTLSLLYIDTSCTTPSTFWRIANFASVLTSRRKRSASFVQFRVHQESFVRLPDIFLELRTSCNQFLEIFAGAPLVGSKSKLRGLLATPKGGRQ